MNLSGTGNTNPFAPALTAAFGVSSGSTGEQLKLYNSLNDYGLSVAGGGGTLTTSTTTKKTENRITIGRDGKASISYGNTQVISRTVTEKNGNIIDSSTTNSREGTSKGDSKFKALNDWTGFIADYNSSHKTTYNFVVITITNIAMVATTIATMNPLMGPEGMVASYSLLLLSGPTLYGMQTNALIHTVGISSNGEDARLMSSPHSERRNPKEGWVKDGHRLLYDIVFGWWLDD